MRDPISIRLLLSAIRKLPPDEPVHHPSRWYLTQKSHWMGWLSEYEGAGAYGRKTGVPRDAKFAYNHVVCSELLLYLASAAKVEQRLIDAAASEFDNGASLMQKSGAIRKIIPWETVATAIWPNYSVG